MSLLRRTSEGLLIVVGCLWITVAGIFVQSFPVAGQGRSGNWSSPEVVVRTDGTTGFSALVADQAGELHLIHDHRPDESSTGGLDYTHWDGSGWSFPVNILLNPDGSDARLPRATIDAGQTIHLVWSGGMNRLWYANAPAARAGTPRGWSEPQAIATAITEAGIDVGPGGIVYVAYADASASGTVAMVSSTDGGAAWSAPVTVALTAAGTTPGEVDLAVDGAGRLHVTWTEHTLPDGVPLTGVFYTRSVDGDGSWQEPRQVDGERHGEIGVGAVGNDQIHLVWRSNIGGDGTFHQWSDDGGETWSAPDRHDDRGGISGMPSFAVDSAGGLHYTIGPAKVASWRDGRLGPYVDVAGEARRRAEQEPGGTSPELAAIAITGGNRVHVVFETGFNKIWHTMRLLDVPPEPTVAPAMVSSSTPTRAEESVEGSQPTLVPPTRASSLPGGPPTGPSPASPVLAGAGAALVLTLMIVVWKVGRGTR